MGRYTSAYVTAIAVCICVSADAYANKIVRPVIRVAFEARRPRLLLSPSPPRPQVPRRARPAGRTRLCAIARSARWQHGPRPAGAAARRPRHRSRFAGLETCLRPPPPAFAGLREALLARLGATHPANHRPPVRAAGLTYVLGTVCHPCVRVGHGKDWRPRQDLNLRPSD